VVTADGGRAFPCFPAAILGYVINADDEVLLLSHPASKNRWAVISGGMHEGESPAAALVREVSEEAGPHVMIRPVGLVHTYLYRFDSAIPAMLSIDYAATYLGGDVVPGSDMAMSDIRWAGIDEIERGEVSLVVPTQPWLIRRAVAVHTLLKNEQVNLEPWETTNPHHGAPVEKAIMAVLFTDIVDSTGTTASVGDMAWRSALQGHDRMALRVVDGYGGRIVRHTGDGLLAVFASVVDAVDAAKQMQQEAAALGIRLRAGLHVGEVELTAANVFGQAVVMASRVCDAAAAGELLVSQTVVDLLAGSKVRIERARALALKGLGEAVVFTADTPI
jgi:class 3 adenylate cyclase/8-oxo-dGTP pyrophosphatase MutT (NUDIX family)